MWKEWTEDIRRERSKNQKRRQTKAHRAGIRERHDPGHLVVVDLVEALYEGGHDGVQLHVLGLGQGVQHLLRLEENRGLPLAGHNNGPEGAETHIRLGKSGVNLV
jgi:hypothetical protein